MQENETICEYRFNGICLQFSNYKEKNCLEQYQILDRTHIKDYIH